MGMQALSSSMSTKIPGRPNTAITFVHQLTTSLTMLCMQRSVNDPAGRTQPGLDQRTQSSWARRHDGRSSSTRPWQTRRDRSTVAVDRGDRRSLDARPHVQQACSRHITKAQAPLRSSRPAHDAVCRRQRVEQLPLSAQLHRPQSEDRRDGERGLVVEHDLDGRGSGGEGRQAQPRPDGRGMSESPPDGVAEGSVLPGDYHVHTTFSDGTGSVAECIERAITVGLPEMGIADHVSSVQPTPWEMPTIPFARLERYVEEVRDAASRYDEITVLLGIEADYVPEHEVQLRELLADWPFDYVIGGVHMVDGFDFNDPARRHDPRWSDADALFTAYYGTVRRAAECACFDVIAHLA